MNETQTESAARALRDSVFSTIHGAPAYVSKASEHYFHDRNAIRGDYHFEV